VQLSGNTVYVSEPGALLPRKNLQVLQPPVRLDGEIDPAKIAAAISAHFEAFDLVEGETEVALAFKWRGEPAFDRLSRLARGITLGLKNTIRQEKPLYLILEGDVAQTLGAILKEEWRLKSDVLALDGVALRDFDYIDLGRIRVPSNTVPVTIKSLVFSQDPRVPHRHANDHNHR
jgi:ethanolamine utilization protein EutA